MPGQAPCLNQAASAVSTQVTWLPRRAWLRSSFMAEYGPQSGNQQIVMLSPLLGLLSQAYYTRVGRPTRSAKEAAWGRALGRELQRRRSGRTAEAVAQEAGVSVDTLRRVERGAVASPGFFLVGRIADALGATLDDLLRTAQNTEQEREPA